MARVPSVSPEPYYDANSYRALANNRAMLAGVAELGAKLLREGVLPARVREVVILFVVGALDCAYEIHYHKKAAVAVGLTDVEIAAAVAGDVNRHAEREAAALRYVRGFTRLQVDDALWAATSKHYSPAQIVELGVLAGFYGMIARSISALKVELD